MTEFHFTFETKVQVPRLFLLNHPVLILLQRDQVASKDTNVILFDGVERNLLFYYLFRN